MIKECADVSRPGFGMDAINNALVMLANFAACRRDNYPEMLICTDSPD